MTCRAKSLIGDVNHPIFPLAWIAGRKKGHCKKSTEGLANPSVPYHKD